MPDTQSERAALVEEAREAVHGRGRTGPCDPRWPCPVCKLATALAASEAELQRQREHFKGREVELGDRIDATLYLSTLECGGR